MLKVHKEDKVSKELKDLEADKAHKELKEESHQRFKEPKVL